MKITIEPTTDQSDRRMDSMLCKVSIEHPRDDLDLFTVVELVGDALHGIGYYFDELEVVSYDTPSDWD